MTAPTIELFAHHAAMLDMQHSEKGLNHALAQLAAWMALAEGHLSEEDVAVLGEIGGLMYREGLQRLRS